MSRCLITKWAEGISNLNKAKAASLSKFSRASQITKTTSSSQFVSGRSIRTSSSALSSSKDDNSSKEGDLPKENQKAAADAKNNELVKTNSSSNDSLKSVDFDKVKTEKAKNFDVTSDYNNRQGLTKYYKFKPLESSYVANRPIENPLERAWDSLKPRSKQKTKFFREEFDAFYDVCIIGGGAIGSSVAFFLASKTYNQDFKICVVERDPTYRHCSTTLSAGGIRQQFSNPENVEMSLYGADFLRNAGRLLYVHGMDPPDVKFQPHGYLFLASEEGAEAMQENHKTQIACGAKVELMTAKRLKRRFPWLNTDGIALGSYGYENEGWFDPWSLLSALRLKNIEMGVHYIHGDVMNIAHEVNRDKLYEDTPEDELEDEMKRLSNPPREAHIHLPDGDVWPLTSAVFVIAAGANSGHVANMAGIGCGPQVLKVPLPVEPRKRYVYNVHAPKGPGLATPMVIDPTGFYFRRDGHAHNYLCGMSPPSDAEEPDVNNPDVDYDFFEKQIWPLMANRVPAFEELKVKGAWAGFYDYNTHDQNAILGNHPYHMNIHFATGCSGHGIQQAPAIGRAVCEAILDGSYETINLTRFNYDRILNDEYVRERNIV